MWDSTTGVTNSDYAWVTYNPTADRDSKGDPVSSEIITQKDTTFQHKMIEGDDTFYITDTENEVKNFDSYFRGVQNNYLATRVSNTLGLSSGDPQTASYITPCSYGNYTHDVYLYPSGNTTNTASIVLHYFRDDTGIWGESGATHYLTLDFNSDSGATVSINKGQSARAFQRDLYGEDTVSGNPEGSDDDTIQAIVAEAITRANLIFEQEYPDLAHSAGGGSDEELPLDGDHEEDEYSLSPYESFIEWQEIYNAILLEVYNNNL